MELREVNEFNYTFSKELNENGEPKKFYLKGVFQAADTPNGNKRVYPRAVLESCVEKTRDSVTGRQMLGELDHPDSAKINLEKVSHVVTKLEMLPDGKMYGEAEVLRTASGMILQSLLESNVKLGISSRGFGSTVQREGLDEVQNDFNLVTFDIVSNPSTPGAFPNAVYEDKQHDQTTSDEDAVIDLETFLSDALNENVEVEMENKEFVCTNGEGTRFYIVEGDRESYGTLNFHISHNYHILVKNEEYQERVGFSNKNLQLLEDIHGENVYNKIINSVDKLGYDLKTLNKKKED